LGGFFASAASMRAFMSAAALSFAAVRSGVAHFVGTGVAANSSTALR
jgi:hypothetical protein